MDFALCMLFVIFIIAFVIMFGFSVLYSFAVKKDKSAVALTSFSAIGGIGSFLLIGFVDGGNSTNGIFGFILFSVAVIGISRMLIKICEPSKATIKKTIVGSIVAIVAVLGILFVWGTLSDSGKSQWDKLSDSEKEWYHDNFGDGQYYEIQDAISDYRGY